MPGLNRVQLIGRLGKDPESRVTGSGKKVCRFTLAVERGWKKDGEIKKITDWFNLEAWGRVAEVCQEYLKKGRLIYAEGSLRTERYEQEGETRYFTKVVLSNMQMLGRPTAEPELPEEDDDIPLED